MLGHTVYGATFSGQADDGDRHNTVFGEAAGKDVLCHCVVAVTEGWYQQQTVAQQIIQVAGIGEAAAGSEQRVMAITYAVDTVMR